MPLLQSVRDNHAVIRICLAGVAFAIGVLCVLISSVQPRIEIEVALCFTLCILSMLVLSYQCLLPRWTRKMSNNAALSTCAALDSLSTVLWISTFAGMVSWIERGMLTGSTATASCSNFGNGSELSCRLAKTTSVFAAISCALFAATASISVWEMVRYRRSGELPSRLQRHDELALVDQEDDAWSVVVVGPYQKDESRTEDKSERDSERGRFTIMQSTETSEGRHPGRKIASYGSQKSVGYEVDLTPSALSPMDQSPVALVSRMGTFSRPH